MAVDLTVEMSYDELKQLKLADVHGTKYEGLWCSRDLAHIIYDALGNRPRTGTEERLYHWAECVVTDHAFAAYYAWSKVFTELGYRPFTDLTWKAFHEEVHHPSTDS